MSLRFLVVSWVALAACGCSGDKSLVAMSARVESPTLTVESSAIGADATGGFVLVMALGEYATEDTQVSLGSFSIQRGGVELLSPLSLSGANFPVALGVGKKITLPLTFDASTEPAVADALCQGTVEVVGTLMDTLSNDHPTPVKSAAFAAKCE
jgi:hypothetical protein